MQIELRTNSYLTRNKKTKNTFIVCIRSQNVQKDETLCYKKKNTKLIVIIGWLACNEWT